MHIYAYAYAYAYTYSYIHTHTYVYVCIPLRRQLLLSQEYIAREAYKEKGYI